MPLGDDPLWFKDAIIYEAHVKSFFDSNDDGIGDFNGLTSKLDYLQDLGITCLWLLPFFPSPLKDDGYDISDYRNIHPSYGTLADFKAFVAAAHLRGIHVLIELVVNHTSDQHPWFQAARRAPRGSRLRNFYVWSDTDKAFPETRIIFTDSEPSNWTYDAMAGQYYWHRFFSHQPDLNHNNPEVVDAVIEIMTFWLEAGVDALRLDAVPYLCVREGTSNENLPETHEVLKQIRRTIDQRFPHAMLLGEANQWPADVRPYFGEGDECHMAFHFPLMPRIFMAVRLEDRHPITDILRQTPEIPQNCQWALFLRNHDELTLEMVTDEERDYMYQAYATDPLMRLNVGIRRRLAPLLENSRRRAELLNVLLFTLPGTPVVYYGDELMMGDNIYLGDRNGVRTPMQWSGDRNAGFSRADPARLYAPPIMDPVYGFQAINVEAQQRYPFSTLNWMKRLIGLRKRHPVLGRGGIEFVSCSNRKVLAYLRRDGQDTLLVVCNLSRNPQPASLDLSALSGLVAVELLGETEFPRIGGSDYFLTLGPYGYLVFRIQQSVAPVRARPVPEPVPDTVDLVPALLAGTAWQTLLDGAVRSFIERDVLVPYLRRQLWMSSRADEVASARFIDWAMMQDGVHPAFLTIVNTTAGDGSSVQSLLPLATTAADAGDRTPVAVLAQITGARKGLMIDATADDAASRRMVDLIAEERRIAGHNGTFRGLRAPSYIPDEPGKLAPISRPGRTPRHTSVHFGTRKALRVFRELVPGVHPEIETASYLASRDYRRVPPLAGWLEYESDGGLPTTVAVLEGLVRNQGDVWSFALDELGRYFESVAAAGQQPDGELLAPSRMAWAGTDAPAAVTDLLGLPLSAALMLGRRTAELHRVLAASADDPAFGSEPLTHAALVDAIVSTRQSADRTRAALAIARDQLDDRLRTRTDLFLEQFLPRLEDHAALIETLESAGARIRVHGDLHLAHVLWVEQDFVFVATGTDPRLPWSDRRTKRSPLVDVATLVRSFGYAAAVGLLAIVKQQPANATLLTAWAGVWGGWMGAGFLRGYRAEMAGTELVPDQADRFAVLLQWYLIDRALDELRQEASHRREWMDIPLAALEQLLS